MTMRLEPRREQFERRGRGDAERRMGLRCGRERLGHADVELLVTDAKPRAAAGGEQRRLLDLLQPQELAVEDPGIVLAARRRRDLDVVEPDDHRER